MPPEKKAVFESEDGRSRVEVHDFARRVSWQHVVNLARLKDLCHLNRLLCESISAYRKGFMDRQELAALHRVLDERSILLPEEGDIPYVLLDDILGLFQGLGFSELLVGDEFGQCARETSIHDLLALPYPVLPEHHPRLLALDLSILVTVHWDLFYTIMCGPRDLLRDFAQRHRIEGFFCNEETRVHWDLQEQERIIGEFISSGDDEMGDER